MISSQVLLTGFISYWLISQYRKERVQLQAELEHVVLNAYDQQVDSLLMKHLIAPTLNDSIMLRVDLSEVHAIGQDNDTNHTSVILKHLEGDSLDAANIFAFRMDDSVGLEEDRLVRSVKLFINQTDEAFRTNAEAHAFNMKIDSGAFMQIINDQLLEKDWDFTLDWCRAAEGVEKTNRNKGVVIEIHSLNEIPALRVQHIHPYLLGLMWPEFIFALVLLSLSVSSLIILYRSLEKQLALNELRNDFIANISHELKTPVSTVKVALEALQKFDLKKDPGVSAEYLEMASRETVRLEGLVGKVLQHQLLENPGSMIHLETCDLGKILESALKSMEIPIREYEASVTFIEANLPCAVRADPVYLEGVIINLIDNSLKYAGPHPEIEAGMECNEKSKKLIIRDKGPGIPEEYRDQVFDKFFRIPAGDRHNVKGYGLGLNFAAQVMHQLGGSISFRNLSGGGCEFILEFPMW